MSHVLQLLIENSKSLSFALPNTFSNEICGVLELSWDVSILDEAKKWLAAVLGVPVEMTERVLTKLHFYTSLNCSQDFLIFIEPFVADVIQWDIIFAVNSPGSKVSVIEFSSEVLRGLYKTS